MHMIRRVHLLDASSVLVSKLNVEDYVRLQLIELNGQSINRQYLYADMSARGKYCEFSCSLLRIRPDQVHEPSRTQQEVWRFDLSQRTINHCIELCRW